MPTEQEWMEVRERLRYEVEHPNLRVNQIHRNEWPKLWRVIDEIVSVDFVLGEDEDEDEDLPIPEVPMVAEFDEDDELVGMEALPDIPEPGETLTANHDPVDPDDPGDEEFDLNERGPGFDPE